MLITAGLWIPLWEPVPRIWWSLTLKEHVFPNGCIKEGPLSDLNTLQDCLQAWNRFLIPWLFGFVTVARHILTITGVEGEGRCEVDSQIWCLDTWENSRADLRGKIMNWLSQTHRACRRPSQGPLAEEVSAFGFPVPIPLHAVGPSGPFGLPWSLPSQRLPSCLPELRWEGKWLLLPLNFWLQPSFYRPITVSPSAGNRALWPFLPPHPPTPRSPQQPHEVIWR